jgi:hypothetical protein|tara:strand:+ start:219 stop:947 length:729 start_codon:yes stop_codon:yes gene_type:complete
MSEFKIPTEEIELPSKGLVYPEDNPLSSGKVEMKYMTAKEEDILTNQSYIKKGVVIDKLLQSLIVSKVDYNDLIIGDKNALMVAARILGYGKKYEFKYDGEEIEVDLSLLEPKSIDESNFPKGQNDFLFTLPSTQTPITFKLLTHKDENSISRELDGLKKLSKTNSPELSTRLKYIITSIDGDPENKNIREFVDKYMLAQDARALRKHIDEFQPDIDLSFFPPDSEESESIPINLNFFWPDL